MANPVSLSEPGSITTFFHEKNTVLLP